MKLFTFFSKKKQKIKFLNISLYLFCSIHFIHGVPEFAKPKKIDRNVPVNAKERARKNVEKVEA